MLNRVLQHSYEVSWSISSSSVAKSFSNTIIGTSSSWREAVVTRMGFFVSKEGSATGGGAGTLGLAGTLSSSSWREAVVARMGFFVSKLGLAESGGAYPNTLFAVTLVLVKTEVVGTGPILTIMCFSHTARVSLNTAKSRTQASQMTLDSN